MLRKPRPEIQPLQSTVFQRPVSVDPIKIYEYLALGLKVVSTPMGAIHEYPLTFLFDEFGLTQAIERALAYKPTQLDWRKTDDLLSQATWRARLISMLERSGVTM